MAFARILSSVASTAGAAISDLTSKMSSGQDSGKMRVVSVQAFEVESGWQAFAVIEEISADDDLQKKREEEFRQERLKHDLELEHNDSDEGNRHIRQEIREEIELEERLKEQLEYEFFALGYYHSPAIVYEEPIAIPLKRDYIPEDVPVPAYNRDRLQWLGGIFRNDFDMAEYGTASSGGFFKPGMFAAPAMSLHYHEGPQPEPA